ncbi:hypothetical protein [Nocardioides sp. YIM 152315]|uniref:hypothetical protein n=1 Tax=Nocardioides sp. YIM 152315 TaxID=3031760 RepID=UPI0023DA2D01|nr:hypothetical protein [Nocardioides sp. YIM 152315]MDF1603386.1 hypothetical protein [Nocardioides sp. YIM 152315]
MTRGGARNRSGPQASEDSGRSDRRGYVLTALPAEGYDGPVPDFPLPAPSARELEVWEEAWRSPQACAWSLPSESWRAATVAMWVRVKVRCEDPDVGAALLGQLHRFADQIGMTTAGLAEMGWRVAVDETATKRQEKAAEKAPAKSSRDRMKVVGGDG